MDDAARQLIRAIRGRRSQVAFSRRLGYRGNVVAKWEGGHRFPTFGEVLRACGRAGVDVEAALDRFHPPTAPLWVASAPQQIGPWLKGLQGGMSQASLAERAGLSRQQVGRLTSGRAQGRLPKVMALIDAMTGRLPDLVAELVPIDQVPILARKANMRHALARLASAHPWSTAAQTWLDTTGEIPAASAASSLASSFGLDLAHAETLVAALVEAGVAEVRGGLLRQTPTSTVEINTTPEDFRRIRDHWAMVSARGATAGADGNLFSFNVFAVSRADLDRIHESQRRFYREVRSIVADSPPEVVALLTVHTLPLS